MTTPTSKRTTSPAFQFYPKEFLSSSKVIAMTATERGVYITLLATQWLDGSLPDDLPALARLNGLNPKAFARMWPKNLGRCFTLKNGRLVNPRLEIIRQSLIAYKKKQAENGAKGGRPSGKPVGSSGITQAEPEKRSASVSVSASSSSSEERTHRQGGAPIHQSHRSHAACGRICVPAELHGRLLRARNHPNADTELRDWYAAVDEEWSVGAKKDTETGGDDFEFWRARYKERWPAAATAAGKPNEPEWVQRAKAAQKAARS